MNDKETRELIERAHDHEHGIEIETSDVKALQRRFYCIRAKLREDGDSSMDSLMFRIMNQNTVHIINKGGKLNGKARPREGDN